MKKCNCKIKPIEWSRKRNLFDITLEKLPLRVFFFMLDIGYNPPEPIIELCKHDQKSFDDYVKRNEYNRKYKY